MDIRLILEAQKFDLGLEEIISCSQAVKLDEQHHHLVEFYKCYLHKEIFIPVTLSSIDSNIFYRTSGDGKALQLEEKKAPELKA
ncbi:hypothetical protein F935_01234 [Acinetobacter calcoaceticus ANC 3811]|uniref:Uncharacterized protein n=1 Tax=Acinetobacter calcoaceticus ANC 3811 TaxID=1217690 RepID=R8Y2D3_ACICA|nr:hypothetical protein [Acinetobacter calcoaceticus]EOQ63605.1 hypothetical protein F935_01234 [Acinetobacter calcoaceticus ANC 3811]